MPSLVEDVSGKLAKIDDFMPQILRKQTDVGL